MALHKDQFASLFPRAISLLVHTGSSRKATHFRAQSNERPVHFIKVILLSLRPQRNLICLLARKVFILSFHCYIHCDTELLLALCNENIAFVLCVRAETHVITT